MEWGDMRVEIEVEWYALKMEDGTINQGMQAASRNWKRQEIISPLNSPGGM